jgi:hypothetical protein
MYQMVFFFEAFRAKFFCAFLASSFDTKIRCLFVQSSRTEEGKLILSDNGVLNLHSMKINGYLSWSFSHQRVLSLAGNNTFLFRL